QVSWREMNVDFRFIVFSMQDRRQLIFLTPLFICLPFYLKILFTIIVTIVSINSAVHMENSLIKKVVIFIKFVDTNRFERVVLLRLQNTTHARLTDMKLTFSLAVGRLHCYVKLT
ncbi:hypothetical protein L9F63_005435, partial [Diploptera punctata]